MTENEAVSKDIYSFYDDMQAHDFILSLKHTDCTHPFTEIKKPNIVFILLAPCLVPLIVSFYHHCLNYSISKEM